MFRKRVYMDWAAATPLHRSVVRAMRTVERAYGNPSAPHAEGREARALIDSARTRIARTLGVKADELVFTSGGTESNNLALGWVPDNCHVIISAFEHPSVAEAAEALKSRGVTISYARPNTDGIVTPDAVEKLLQPTTALVSIVAVQSEIGAIQPIREIARMLETRAPKVILHTDACQNPMFLDLSPHRLGADLVTYDAQKIRGPKGAGLLYHALRVPLTPVTHGGKQERHLRPGTENTVDIVGMAEAFGLAQEMRMKNEKRVREVRDYFINLLKQEVPEAELNGGVKHRIANNINISIPGADGDYLAVLMDARGVSVSPRSACITDGAPSSAVLALGKSETAARGTLRFTLGPGVSTADARAAIAALKSSVKVVLDK